MLIVNQLTGFGGGSSSAAFTALGRDFNGSADYMTKAGFTGAADGRQGILSFWYRLDGTGSTMRPFCSANSWVNVQNIGVSGKWSIGLGNLSVGQDAFRFETVSSYASTGTWHHFYASWNTNFSAGSKVAIIKIDGTTDYTITDDAKAAFDIDYTENFGVGARYDGNSKFDGCLAEFYFNQSTYSTDHTPFVSAGKPISLGATGSLPTGAQPLVYLRIASAGAASDFNTNLGSGGSMTTVGSASLSSTNPTD